MSTSSYLISETTKRILMKCGIDDLRQGFSTFSRLRATLILSYQIAGRNVINEDNLLKRHCDLLKILLNWAYYCIRVHMLLDNFL
jgi:hypothetical protein